jgi:hypothetical protein
MLGDDLGRYGGGLKQLYDCLRRLALVSPRKEDAKAELSGGSDSANVKDDNVFDEEYAIVLTTAPPGSIPPRVWRASYVIHV